MISVRNLTKQYEQFKAVDNISFEIASHETLVLLGTSGCGKTTTLKMINRLIEPTSGEVYIDGKNVQDQPPELLRRQIGYVLQNTGLFPHYTIAENIAIVPQLLKWEALKTKNRTAELLEKLHLPLDVLQKYPAQLSGGQQQRAGLARALIADPPVLLMDEPFGALDNITRNNIRAEFKALDELTRKTIIMVTHDVDEAFDLGDRICLMDQGKIVQIGTPQDLLFKPANDFAQRFLQGQRTQLELKTVSIEKLWHLLPSSSNQNEHKVDASASVWNCIAAFSGQTDKITFRNTADSKTISLAEMMSAFQQYQKQPQPLS